MARYTCRTLTEGSFVDVTAASSKPQQRNTRAKAKAVAPKAGLQHPERDLKKTRHAKREVKLVKVIQSKKKVERKAKVEQVQQKKLQTAVRLTHVFVGNLDTSIDAYTLESFFNKHNCGKIHRTTMRTSRGIAVQPGIRIPDEIKTKRDGLYASVEFWESASVLKALHLNGKYLDGCKVVITLDPCGLPEFQDIMDRRKKELEGEQSTSTAPSLPAIPGAWPPKPVPLEREPTELMEVDTPAVPTTPRRSTRNSRHNAVGRSFAKTVL